LLFFGDAETPLLFARAVQDLEQLGGIAVTVDYTPFREAAELLYQGPWVGERLAGLNTFSPGMPKQCTRSRAVLLNIVLESRFGASAGWGRRH
jgi:allophanate hydrolase